MNKKGFFWLIPVLALALTVFACSSGNDNDDNGGGTEDNLSFSDKQVYNPDLTLYTGTGKPFTSNGGGTGAITDGKMTFNIGVPNNLKPMGTFLGEMDTRVGYSIFTRATFNPGNTQASNLEFSIKLSKKIDMTVTHGSMEEIYYIYVDRDCTVTAKEIPPITYAGISVPVPNFTLNLKQGWNPVDMALIGMAVQVNTTPALLIGTGDSASCKWVLQ